MAESKAAPARRRAEGVLSVRALNRILLERQWLMKRRKATALRAMEHLVGLQSQAPAAPYVGLWTRIEGFRADELSTAMMDRRAVRIALMRSTIFLVSAEDCLRLRPLVQPVLTRGFVGGWAKRIQGLDVDAVAAAGRQLVEEKPRTWAELGEALSARFPGFEVEPLWHIVRTHVPVVQVTPRGVWGKSGASRHTSVEAWLGRAPEAEPSLEEVLMRYLAAFGPATVRDAQAWCGLTRLGELFERMRPRLLTFRDDTGAELFDLPDAPRPTASTAAPVRFLPEYDNILLSHADRRRILTDEVRARLMTPNGIVRGTVLLDGFVCAMWKVVAGRAGAVMRIETFAPIQPGDRSAISDEGDRLLDFVAPGSERDIQFTAA